jgi:glucose-6-phosphate dehydrogenase assembly protein OpcA
MEWHGEDVEIDDVADRLLRMNRDHAHRAHGHAATRTLTLLVAPGRGVATAALADRLDDMRTRHPARSVLLCEHEADRLDASLRIECAVGSAPGETGYCHDAVVLRASAARLRHADSLVHALLIAGLPTVLWLPGGHPSAAEAPLAALAGAVVLDSGAAPDVAAAFARAARLGERAHVRDLAWLALARWRQRIAAAFDAPAARALLARTDRLVVRCGGADLATPLLLAGWIAARADWQIAELGPAAGARAWRASARQPDGGEVTLTVGAPDSHEPAGIHALTFHAGEETLELVEPVAELDAARAFAAALRTFDEPASGYVAALAALQKGIASR